MHLQTLWANSQLTQHFKEPYKHPTQHAMAL